MYQKFYVSKEETVFCLYVCVFVQQTAGHQMCLHDGVLYHSTQFWRFAVTGACNNQEIKIWSCESWVCLQTLR